MPTLESTISYVVNEHKPKKVKIGNCELAIAPVLIYRQNSIFRSIPNAIELEHLWVARKHRGKGQAKQALKHLCNVLDMMHVTCKLTASATDYKTETDRLAATEKLVKLYKFFGFVPSGTHKTMIRNPKKGTEMKHQALIQTSVYLATAGIKHRVVIANGLSKYADNSKQFAETVVKALKEQASETSSDAVVKAHVMKILIKLLPAFNGKKFGKLQVDKITEAVKHSDVYESCFAFLRKDTRSMPLQFTIRYGRNERSEFSIYLKSDEDGKFDAHKTLADNKTHFDNVIQTAKKTDGIDEAKLLPMLVRFRELGEEIADMSGTYVTSFSDLIDFISRH